MAIDRGLYLKEPHAQWLAEGKKTLLVKSKHYKIPHPVFILGKKNYGVIALNEPRKIGLKEFHELADKHLITETERNAWWPNKKEFWAYDIKSLKSYKSPRSYQYKPGAQVFIKTAMEHNMKFIDVGKVAKAFIPGGNNRNPKDFNQADLKKGMKVESEHTTNKNIQREIAMDHLSEFPDYYEALEKMEDRLKREKTAEHKLVALFKTEGKHLISKQKDALAATKKLPKWGREPGMYQPTRDANITALKSMFKSGANWATSDARQKLMKFINNTFPQVGIPNKLKSIPMTEKAALPKITPTPSKVTTAGLYKQEVSVRDVDQDQKTYVKIIPTTRFVNTDLTVMLKRDEDAKTS